MGKKWGIGVGLVGLVLSGGYLRFIGEGKTEGVVAGEFKEEAAMSLMPTGTPTLSPTPLPTATPSVVPTKEAQAVQEPCAKVPVLTYHHVQDMAEAGAQGHAGLTVSPEYFRKQMEYLRDRGYSVISMQTLVNFFDGGVALPPKPVLVTFDDGYDNFATHAYPILSQLGFAATVFLPTGLMNNPGYLSWEAIDSMAGGGKILFANHTWSHKSVQSNPGVEKKEIGTADGQLAERGLNSPRVFAYPYGKAAEYAKEYLASLGYKLAFTTYSGSKLCAGQRLALPRVRVGNASLSAYGF